MGWEAGERAITREMSGFRVAKSRCPGEETTGDPAICPLVGPSMEGMLKSGGREEERGPRMGWALKMRQRSTSGFE